MKKLYPLLIFIGFILSCSTSNPIRLHPQNPHYFEWKGQPTVLISSTEHYGAVLNTDFDFHTYLSTLEQDGLNLTRTFSGVYCEHPEAFNITKNTLAPASGKFICPWKRSDEPGYANGGNKFDLTQWDDAYFNRLDEFMDTAQKHGVVVEFVLFCPFYGDEQWALSPLNSANNINGVGDVDRTEVYTLKHDDLTKVQNDMVRMLVIELNEYDNLYYEICNEPYFAGPTLEWQAHIAGVIRETEANLAKKHMIAQNIANNTAKIENPGPNVDLFNFHYAHTSAVDDNYALNKALGDDETGFAGTEDLPYRLEAWNFILAGGALFDHLDYSFTTDNEDGTFAFPATQPGGGGVAFRKQVRILKEFIESFDFINMAPTQDIFASLPDGLSARALGKDGEEYAVYFSRKQQTKQFYSLRWSGKITAPFSEKYTFYTVTDDGARLWINGAKLIDDWTSHAPTENSGSIDLKAGEMVDIRFEFYQGAGGAKAELLWSSASQPKAAIGSEFYHLPDGKAPGLKLEWFDDINLEHYKADAVVFDASFNGSLDGLFTAEEQQGGEQVVLSLPAGDYEINWIDTLSGDMKKESVTSDGIVSLEMPEFKNDIALSIRK